MRRDGDGKLWREEDYWDGFLQGRLPNWEIDPALADAITRTHALDDATAPDPSFVQRLIDVLTSDSVAPGRSDFRENTIPLSTFNGIVKPNAGLGKHVVDPAGWTPKPWYAPRVLALLLLLAMVTGGAIGIRISTSGSGGNSIISIPAPIVSPEATPESGLPTSPPTFLWETRGDPSDLMTSSPFIAIAPDGSIWVTDEATDRIRIFSPDGILQETWGGPGTGEGQFDFSPKDKTGFVHGAVAFDEEGNVFVLDTGNLRVQKFGPDRKFLTSWGGEGIGDGEFMAPMDIAVDLQGRVIVLDEGRSQLGRSPAGTFLIQVFDDDGNLLDGWGTFSVGPEPGKIMDAFALGIGPDGTIFVTEGGVSTIHRFTSEGEYIDTLAGFGKDDGQFFQMKDVAVDDLGRIFAVDWSKNLVTVLDRDGQYLASWGEKGAGAGQLHFPYGLALDGKGNIYVTDDNGRLQKFRIGSLPELAATPTM